MSYSTEKERQRALYPFVKKGLTTLSNLLGRTAYWKLSKMDVQTARKNADDSKGLDIKDRSGVEITGNHSIQFDLGFLNSETPETLKSSV